MKIKNTIESPKKFDVEKLIKFLGKELNIGENVQLTVAYNEDLLSRLSNETIEYKAFLHHPKSDLYYIFVTKEKIGLNKILCHEMVHVHQCERGDLQYSPDYKTVTWKDNVFDRHTKYDDREWEEEAFDLQDKLWKKFKNENNI